MENTQIDYNLNNGYSNYSDKKASEVKKEINNSGIAANNYPPPSYGANLGGSAWAAGASGLSSPAKNPAYESGYHSKRTTLLDDQGFVPEDSVMDFGQTTIDDLNKV